MGEAGKRTSKAQHTQTILTKHTRDVSANISHAYPDTQFYSTIYSWDMHNFDGSFILSHKHKIILRNFTESFLNVIRTLSENIKFFDQEMVRSGNDRILMQKIE